MTPRHPWILSRDKALLLVVDIQEPLLRVIWERDRLIAGARLLIQACDILGVPIVSAVQYAQRLGGLAPEIAEVFPKSASTPVDKRSFSCAGHPGFTEFLAGAGRSQILLCGIETHVCVQQTALDLLQRGYQVHCAADAVSSRSVERHKLGMEKMRDAGVIPCGAESAVFELLRVSDAPEFKAVHALVK